VAGWWFSPGTLDSTNNKLCQRVTAGWWFSPGTLVSSTNNKLLQRVAAGWWFSPGTLVSSTNKTDRHDITEILLNVVLTTINIIPSLMPKEQCFSYVVVRACYFQ
jgi:hypothetical protein